MNELSLFSGAGGGLLGSLLLRHIPIGYVELNDYCQQVISARIRDGILPDAPIFGDIKTFISDGYAASYTGLVDVITGGFPCQPFSVAGKQKGADDERNMWPSTAECIGIVRPRFVLLENVPGIRSYLPVVVRDLRRLGYEVSRPLILGANDVGAPHRRKRVWIYAHDAELSGYGKHGTPSPLSNSDGSQDGLSQSSDRHATYSQEVRRREGNAISGRAREGKGTQGEWCGSANGDFSLADASIENDGRYLRDQEGGQIQQSGISDEPPTFTDAQKRKDNKRDGRDMDGTETGREGVNAAVGAGDSNDPHADPARLQGGGSEQPIRQSGQPDRIGGDEERPWSENWPEVATRLCRVDDGVASRVDRLKAIGNGQVPRVAATAWRILTQ